MEIDPAKLPSSFAGKLSNCWAFDPRGECQIIGRIVTDPTTNPINGWPGAYLFTHGDYRVAVFGVPLYFCRQDQVHELFQQYLLPTMLAGL